MNYTPTHKMKIKIIVNTWYIYLRFIEYPQIFINNDLFVCNIHIADDLWILN